MKIWPQVERLLGESLALEEGLLAGRTTQEIHEEVHPIFRTT
jgi:hypothetical protein